MESEALAAREAMVKAMARAICQADEQNGGAPWDWYGSDKARSGYYDSARAALAAAMPIIGEEMAIVANSHRLARLAARDNAKARKAKAEARDHESMAIEAAHITASIRAHAATLAKEISNEG